MTEPATATPPGAGDWPTVLDGELTTAARAHIPATDDGLIRGDGAFDALLVRDGRPFARAAHLDRLERSCQAIALPCPRDLLEADIDLLLRDAGPGDLVVRVVVTRGGHRLCRLEALGDPGEHARPLRLAPVVFDPTVLLDGIKTLSYAANMLASRRALADGFDEALLVRSDGTVLEGPTCSIFWAHGDTLCTPALSTGILDSITRRVVLESLGAQEGVFALSELAGADEAFLASTGHPAQPVAAIGEVVLPSAPGPQTLRAREAIERAIEKGTIA